MLRTCAFRRHLTSSIPLRRIYLTSFHCRVNFVFKFDFRSFSSSASSEDDEFAQFLAGKALPTDVADPEHQGCAIVSQKSVVQLNGLRKACVGSEITLASGQRAVVMSLQKDGVEAALLDRDDNPVSPGTTATLTSEAHSFPVGIPLIGRVLDGFGTPIDGKGDMPEDVDYAPTLLEKMPSFMSRSLPIPGLHYIPTGVKAMDIFRPLIHGSRYGIFGLPNVGKTRLALDVIFNQKAHNDERAPEDKLYCIYVSIGQSRTDIDTVIQNLQARCALDYTTVIAVCESDSFGLQFLAPFLGAAVAAHFRNHGQHALIVYDDLTAHTLAYKRLARSLEFPVDSISFLQAQLLERSCVMSNGGSSTSLCLVTTPNLQETIEISPQDLHELPSYVDERFYLDGSLAADSVWPAVSFNSLIQGGLSELQAPALHSLMVRLQQMLRESHEAIESQRFVEEVGVETDTEEIQHILGFAPKFQELLFQSSLVSLPDLIVLFYAIGEGYLYDVPTEALISYEANLLSFVRQHFPEVISALRVLDLSDFFPANVAMLLDYALAHFHKEHYHLQPHTSEPQQS